MRTSPLLIAITAAVFLAAGCSAKRREGRSVWASAAARNRDNSCFGGQAVN